MADLFLNKESGTDITFNTSGRNIINITCNGEIIINGEVTTDAEVIGEALKEFAKSYSEKYKGEWRL